MLPAARRLRQKVSRSALIPPPQSPRDGGSDQVETDAVPLVRGRRALVAADERERVTFRGDGDESIVNGAARHRLLRERENELTISSRSEPHERLAESSFQKVPDHAALGPMGRWEPGEDGVRFERAMLDEPHSAIENGTRRAVLLVPGGKSSDDDATIDGSHRLMRSVVSLT